MLPLFRCSCRGLFIEWYFCWVCYCIWNVRAPEPSRQSPACPSGASGLGVVDYSLRDLFVKALKCTTHLSALNILFGRMMSCFTGSPFKRLRSRLVLSNRGCLLKSGRTYRFIAPATCSHRSFPVLFNLRAYRARPTNLECLVDRSPQPQCRLNLYISRVGAGLRFV